MTAGQKVEQTLGMMKMLSGNFQTFALETQDPAAKQLFSNCSQQLDQMISDVNRRAGYIESQEPQYKMENMTQQQAQMQQANTQSMRKE